MSGTALVTGGAGFIGRTLAAHLTALGRRVVIVDRVSPGTGPGSARVALRQGDIRDRAFVQSILEDETPEAVYHLAAIHYIPACDRDPVECVSVNTTGSVSLLEACARLEHPPVCVLASTAAVYAPSETALVEDDALGPVDIYGFSKLWLEQVAAMYASRNGLRVRLARLFNVYGPGETNPHLIPSLIDQALAGGTIRVGDLSTRRDYVHVRDVAGALIAMADAQDGGLSCLNVGTGNAISGREVVDAIARAFGRPLDVFTDDSRLRRVDRPVLLSDPTRAAALLGWRARIPFEEGMRELVNDSVAAGSRI